MGHQTGEMHEFKPKQFDTTQQSIPISNHMTDLMDNNLTHGQQNPPHSNQTLW